ncbi:MAG: hypothetical protein HQ541_19195 [Mariniphaga sp.]|nr:hypothetical protein [Mariniphaga sp.]
MKTKTIGLILVIVLIIMPAITKSQSGPERKFYKKGIIQLQNRQSYTGENLVFDSGQLTFKDTKNLQPVTIPFEDIKYIKAQTGSWALEGVLLGGLLGGLAVLGAYADAGSNPYVEVKEERIPYVVGGLVVGSAIVGALFKKEKIIFKDNKFMTGVFINKENLAAYGGPNVISISVRIQFPDS